MQNQSNFTQGLSMEQLMKLANSPQGQALLSQLQQSHPQALQSAMANAQAGNYEQVRQSIQEFLQSPEGAELMRQFRGKHHG